MTLSASCQTGLVARLLLGLTAILLCTICLLVPGSARANGPSAPPDEIKLVTLNWPPYTGGNLPDYGITSHLVGIALDKVSLDHSVSFYPWRRALLSILRDQQFDGIYPLYHTPEREQQFLLSDPIGTSPLGFIHLRSLSLNWRSYSDLSGFTIGFVLGYAYEPQLRSLLESKRLDSIGAPDDETLIKQLVAGHIEVAVMDHNVARHILNSNPDLRPATNLITFNAQLIVEHTLHVGFPPSPRGHVLQQAFNDGLRQAQCFGNECSLEQSVDEPVSLPENLNSQ